MSSEEEKSPIWWMRWLPGIALALFGLVIVLVGLKIVLLPLLASVALAYLLAPATSWLERRGWSRSSSALIAILGACVLLILSLIFILPGVWHQLVVSYDQGSRLVSDQSRVDRLLDRIRATSPLIYDAVQQTVRSYRDPSKQAELRNIFLSWMQGGIFGLVNLTATILDLLLVPFFVYYFLSDYRKIRGRIELLIPPRHRPIASDLIRKLSRVMSTYIRNQMLISLTMGVLYGVGFIALRVPLGFQLGMLSGVLNFIPYLGTITGFILAIGFVALDGAGLWRILGVVGVFGAVQALEGYYLTPKLLGSSLNLHPMWVLAGLLIGANLFGLLGIILAVPVIAAAKVIFNFVEELYRNSRFYRRTGAELLTGEGSLAELASAPSQSSSIVIPSIPDMPERERRVVITTGELRQRIPASEDK
jgi:predicted PurR-regulated permease PerM